MADAQEGKVALEIDGNIAIISFNRGQNRLCLPFFDQLNKALDDIERNPDVKAVITTGGRSRFYSNGIDLEYLASLAGNQELVLKFMEKMYSLLCRFLTFPIPTIAAINGHAYAGGFFLALCHDYRIMRTKKGWLCMSETHLKMRFGQLLLSIIRVKLGTRHLTKVIMAKKWTAEEAFQDHIVQQICDEKDLMKNARVLAEDMVQENYDRQALNNMKADIYEEILLKLKIPPRQSEFQSKL